LQQEHIRRIDRASPSYILCLELPLFSPRSLGPLIYPYVDDHPKLIKALSNANEAVVSIGLLLIDNINSVHEQARKLGITVAE
jgi:hypothetical protein